MANFISGDMKEIFCSHPELGELRLYPKSNESFTVDRGGVSVNDDENSIAGNGEMIKQMNARLWSVEGPVPVDMISDIESDMLNKLSAHPINGTWTFTHISGAVFQGKGCPVGTSNFDSNTGVQTLKVAGGGKLGKIA